MARRFLYVIATLVALVIAGAFILRIWWQDLATIAFVPDTPFAEQAMLADDAYADPAMWLARPARQAEGKPVTFAVFFVHPTSFTEKSAWNAPLDDSASQNYAHALVNSLGGAFADADGLWAPRYRQATFGALLTDDPRGDQALMSAQRDVARAFTQFLAEVPRGQPIVLAGQGQGAWHIVQLLRTQVAGTPLAGRIAAAYAIGQPISRAHDLPALGLPECSAPSQPGCVASWISYAEPAEPGAMLKVFAGSRGFDGQLRGPGGLVCTNPLTGGAGGSAPKEANIGTLVPGANYTDKELVPGAVPARCDAGGLLLIGDPPELGPHVLPGNDYQAYDIALFWANLRTDVTKRVAAWQAAQ